MSREHMIGARVIVALLLGALAGYAIGNSLQKDAERGKALTLKEYVADFDHHKEKLIGADAPIAAAVIVGMLMIAGALGVYELLAFGLGKALQALFPARRPPMLPDTRSAWRSGDQ